MINLTCRMNEVRMEFVSSPFWLTQLNSYVAVVSSMFVCDLLTNSEPKLVRTQQEILPCLSTLPGCFKKCDPHHSFRVEPSLDQTNEVIVVS